MYNFSLFWHILKFSVLYTGETPRGRSKALKNNNILILNNFQLKAKF